jgi:hypothetical protein
MICQIQITYKYTDQGKVFGKSVLIRIICMAVICDL